MSETNNSTTISEATEESIQQSIEELGGIPLIELDLDVSGMTAYPTDTTLEIAGMAADSKAVGDRFDIVEAAVAGNASDIATVEAWTGADIPLNATTGAPSIASQVGTNTTDIADIKDWTGADIPLNDTTGAPTIADAVSEIVSNPYPVGTIYMTVSDEAPDFSGTWVEVAITTTIAQLKTGKHGYTELEEGETGGTVHFWLRTA